MRQYIERKLLQILTKRYANVGTKSELLSRYSKITPIQLTNSEKLEIERLWGKLKKKIDFRYYEFYKALGIYDPRMVPENLYVGYIIRTLNPLKLSKCLQNKNQYPILFQDLKQPEVIINCIQGIWYDKNMSVLNKDNVNQIFDDVDEFIIKPTSESCSGFGIKRLKISQVENFDNLFSEYGDNFICQRIVHQYKKIADINSSSLNTFRVNTFNVNGSITVEDMIFRHGQKGSVVDNGHGGGVCCGINKDGALVGWGYDAKMQRHIKAPNGILYKDIQFPEIQMLMEYAVKNHRKYFAAMGQVAWDLAIDEKKEIILIEVNLGWPGVIFDQMANGKPLFGDRTEEIIDYVASHECNLRWSDFLGNWN